MLTNVKINSTEMVVAMATANKKVTNDMEAAFKKAASKYALKANKEAKIAAKKQKEAILAEKEALVAYRKAQNELFALSDKLILTQDLMEEQEARERRVKTRRVKKEALKRAKAAELAQKLLLRKVKIAEAKAQIAAMTAKAKAKALVKAQIKFTNYYRQFIAELSESQPSLVETAKANFSNYVSLLDKHTVNAVIKSITRDDKFSTFAIKAKGSLMTARKQIIFKYDPIFVQKIKLIPTVENTEEKITSLYGSVQWEGAIEALSDSTLRRVGAYDNYFEDTFGVITRDKFQMKFINSKFNTFELKFEFGNNLKFALGNLLENSSCFYLLRKGSNLYLIAEEVHNGEKYYFYIPTPGQAIRTERYQSEVEFEKAMQANIAKGWSVSKYYYFVDSKASQNRYNATWSLATPEERYKLINKASSHAFEILNNTYKDKEMQAGKFVKTASRLLLPLTNSSAVLPVNKFIYFAGEFLSSEGHNCVDGHGLISSKYFARYMANNTFKTSNLKDLEGINLQGRLGGIKGYFSVVSNEWISRIVEYLNKDIVRVSNNENLMEDLIKIQRGDYKDKVVLFGISNNESAEDFINDADLFVDESVLKVVFDYSRGLDFSIMESPKDFSKYTRMSNQITGGIIDNKDFANTMKEIGVETIVQKLTKEGVEYEEDQNDEFYSADEEEKDITNVSFDVIGNLDAFADNAVLALNKEEALTDYATAARYIKAKLHSCVKAVCKYAFRVKGSYAKVLPDPVNRIGMSLIFNWNEAWSSNKKLQGKEAIIIRHPKSAPREFLRTKFLTKNELVNRVKDLGLSNELSKLILEQYLNIKGANIVLASADKRTAMAIGGSDYDGDGVTIITDERVISLYSHLEPLAIDYGPNVAADTKFVWNKLNVFEKAYAYKIANSTLTVGEIVNFSFSCLGIANELKNSSTEDRELILKKVIEALQGFTKATSDSGMLLQAQQLIDALKGNNKDIYTQRFDTTEDYILISEDIVKNWQMDVLNKYDLSKPESFEALLRDINIAFASVIGRNIDSTGNGAIVTIPFMALKSVVSGGIITKPSSKVDLSNILTGKFIEEDVEKENRQGFRNIMAKMSSVESINLQINYKLKKSNAIITPSIKTKNTVKKYISNDMCARLKNYLFNNIVSKSFAKLVDNTKTNMKKPSSNILSHNINANTIKAFEYMATIYSALMATHKESPMYNIEFLKDAVRGMSRNISKNMSYLERHDYVKRAAEIKDQTGAFVGISRYYQLFGIENIYNILAHRNVVNGNVIPEYDNPVIKEKLYCTDDSYEFYGNHDSFFVDLEKGMSADKKFYTESKALSGRFDIVIEDGKAYAAKNIIEYAKSFDKSQKDNYSIFKIKINENPNNDGIYNLKTATAIANSFVGNTVQVVTVGKNNNIPELVFNNYKLRIEDPFIKGGFCTVFYQYLKQIQAIEVKAAEVLITNEDKKKVLVIVGKNIMK